MRSKLEAIALAYLVLHVMAVILLLSRRRTEFNAVMRERYERIWQAGVLEGVIRTVVLTVTAFVFLAVAPYCLVKKKICAARRSKVA